ncbi:AAA family ATPase [Nocardia inohanensis]|uniref:AAA family ATPase n=1 Tax=Nocardia inohanensis TaxID=209246 RepID=UPI000A97B3B0|nr:AAA family ATPase [Nocardia inohanensis]
MTPMRRILVSGISGAGKTTLATKLAERLHLPRYELDALHHGPGWIKRPEFEAEVERFARTDSWVTEDQYYRTLGGLLWSRADTLIWLDLPRSTVMPRVIRRSALRTLTRRELWNGNRESARNWLQPDHPMRWAWSQHATRRAHTEARIPDFPHLTVIRLRTAAEADAWLRQLP